MENRNAPIKKNIIEKEKNSFPKNSRPINSKAKGKKKGSNSQNSLLFANHLILIFFTTIFLLIESILILLSFFRKGLIKKETLSSNTNLGFDIIIKRYKR